MSRRALLFINRQSRNGARSADMAMAALRQHDIEIVHPDPSLTLSEAIYASAGHVDLIIVGGGDGSLNAAANALIATGLPLGILPLGTANDLARTLAIPKDLSRAVAIIAAGNLRQLDVGMVNERPFFNVASIGFSASLAKNLTAASKRRWGVLGYAFAALKLFRQSRP
ncbi:diacylglycerol kinase family protein, partial [Winslowiella iniecta]